MTQPSCTVEGCVRPENRDGLCFPHKLGTVGLAADAVPTRTPGQAAPARPSNSWERGVVKDERGVPYLGSDLKPIGVKQYADRRGHYDAAKQRLAAEAAGSDTTP